ncbi:CpsD/CapB family tyrosine-protein kinase [Anoxybacillus geothermalis]|uniref:CpsD/CapB family tyrosine-protein kinase n=1 Tax=Geobacillus kaustophilus TaxID=1462 RepID=UPI00067A93B0|nr:CpsD/CapB family tyrosine-protein kinase [Geobacillus kaustophilus]AKU26587.1 capsular biosynthesis protein [Geobacillus sp. LC300]MED4876995.1 CpsD/CapB family tyrosine-protein kinase [Anoxybacillus geothermalis]WJQ00228.1 CpsD/CapB family tyrosine-protein kinase [Geobacillus stearothermophilus]WJQ03623.1 CpsD/CapB family tyrosine-protein kinase [Geobacillus stearothermophilus]WMJ19881.1 CpsD/CapB family tyrosine-protein kinase [Geobacillus kaustophilus]
MAANSRKKFQKAERNLITFDDPKSPISEQYRTIRTNIQFSFIDEPLQSLMVTSSAPSEGKSTTAANLAVVFAQQGKKTVLIDADLRKPTVHYTFRLNNYTGLTSVLTNAVPLLSALQGTAIENLTVLTAGPIPPNPAELLSSKMMDRLFHELKEIYDLVIFDTPPVLAVTDAQILANKCDGTVLVVASGKTETDAAVKAKELLEAANAKIVGVVLNQRKQREGSGYYYYQYK